MSISPRAVLLLALVLPACTASLSPPYLTPIDRRMFRPDVVAPAKGEVKATPALPLATVRFDQSDEIIAQQLDVAIQTALSRKPDAEFNVMTPVPSGGTPSEQAIDDANAVVRILTHHSIDPDKIHVGIAEDPGAPPREVLLYMR